MNANDPVSSQPITCKLSSINQNSDQIILENVEIFHNCLKLPFFGLKIRLLFTDLFRIQVWIRFRIRIRMFISDPDRIRIQPKVSYPDPDPQHWSLLNFWAVEVSVALHKCGIYCLASVFGHAKFLGCIFLSVNKRQVFGSNSASWRLFKTSFWSLTNCYYSWCACLSAQERRGE